MAIIKSGATSDTLTVDITSKAARVTRYDSSGRELSEQSKTTYFAASGPFTPPATPTDVWVMQGSASKTIRILSLLISSTQTTGGVNTWYLIKRSTANTGGTSVAANQVPSDSTNPAGTVTVQHYTANPTVGSAVGTCSVQRSFSPAAAGLASDRMDLLVSGGTSFFDQPLTLRGTSQGLALNFNGAALPAGLSVAITCVWIEE